MAVINTKGMRNCHQPKAMKHKFIPDSRFLILPGPFMPLTKKVGANSFRYWAPSTDQDAGNRNDDNSEEMDLTLSVHTESTIHTGSEAGHDGCEVKQNGFVADGVGEKAGRDIMRINSILNDAGEAIPRVVPIDSHDSGTTIYLEGKRLTMAFKNC
ncbi:hypothetical protein NX059_000910 [Plenodomus lindquistii]|nr:hypothetical protein NX059_000910 [Plenodomus lindquistii]